MVSNIHKSYAVLGSPSSILSECREKEGMAELLQWDMSEVYLYSGQDSETF